MLVLSSDLVLARRAAVRRLNDGSRISTDEEAARYVDERGFCPLMHLSGCELPGISEADTRTPWEGFDITDGAWRWKETLPQAGKCAYGRFLRQRGFFISWRLLPAFYRLHGRPATVSQTPAETDGARLDQLGDGTVDRPDGGPATGAEDYAAGLLGRLEYLVLETVAERGPIDSRQLWRAVKPGFGGNRSRFEQALTTLQSTFRVMVAGGDLAGWSMHRWDLAQRQVPSGLLEHLPSAQEARGLLLRQYVANTVVCTVRELAGFFKWEGRETQGLAQRLLAAPEAEIEEAAVEGWKGTWLAALGPTRR